MMGITPDLRLGTCALIYFMFVMSALDGVDGMRCFQCVGKSVDSDCMTGYNLEHIECKEEKTNTCIKSVMVNDKHAMIVRSCGVPDHWEESICRHREEMGVSICTCDGDGCNGGGRVIPAVVSVFLLPLLVLILL